MARQIAIIQGHPDPSGKHFGHALAAAYKKGAEDAGHEVNTIEVARLEFPLLHSKADWEKADPPESIKKAQKIVGRANHLVLFYPLWLGTMPAILKGFLEQVLRPDFAISSLEEGLTWKKQLGGISARVVVTMGMPALVYRWYFHAHSLKSLEKNILKFCGISPVKESLIGMVEQEDDSYRSKWLGKMEALGRDGK